MLKALCLLRLWAQRNHQTLLIMNGTAFFLFFACLQVSAGGYAQRITLQLKNASLETVFKEIEKQTPYNFAYTDDEIKKARTIDLNIRDGSIEQVLDLCFKDQPLGYSIIQNTIVVKSKEEQNKLQNLVILSDVHGRIAYEDGNPVPGATVSIKGTRRQTITNSNGEFTLTNVDDNAILVISGSGITTTEISVNGR